MKRTGMMLVIILAVGTTLPFSQTKKEPYMEYGRESSCTTVAVGRKASADGSIITAYTCDSGRTRGIFGLVEAKDHPAGAKVKLVQRIADNDKAMPAWKYKEVGTAPQVKHTYGYVNTAYPAMNEHQLALVESTIGYRKGLRAIDTGKIDCQMLYHLLLQRCKNARKAVKLAGELLKRYGWNDWGESIVIADKKEVWVMEIVGPGKGKVGAIWAAQRVPDDHVHVNGNGSRIRQINLDDPDNFMASDNIFKIAKEKGWWNPDEGPFEFCYAYAPNDRTSLGTRRREWGVFSLIAPSLKLHPNSENYPFSVKPDTLVTMEKVVEIYQSYYEGTPYDMTRDVKVEDDSGKLVISPFASPFLPGDMQKLLGVRKERTIPVKSCQFAYINQTRPWMPDEIGGVVWVDWDNPATSIYVPFYNSVTDIPESYKVRARTNGYTRKSAWWAFNRLSGLLNQKWGVFRHDYEKIFNPLQKQFFADQKEIDKKALALFKEDPEKMRQFLTSYCIKCGNMAVKEAWKLGDSIWTKYDGKF